MWVVWFLLRLLSWLLTTSLRYVLIRSGFSLVAVGRGYSIIVMRGLLIVMASLVAEHGTRVRGLSSCSS